MKLTLVTAPASEPVSVSEIKTHLRVDASTEDTYLGALIAVAREHVEQVSWRALLTQTWDLALDDWPSGNAITLPSPPLQSVTSVKYTDEDGVEHTMSSDDYMVDTATEPGRIVLKATASWPSATLREASAVVVRFVAGWTTAGGVPASLVHAIRLLVGHYYENREASLVGAGLTATALPMGIDALIAPHRARRF